MLKAISTLVDASQIKTPITLPGDVTLSTGNLVIGTSGKGIDFSATPGTGTSELLNDYEEGNWTPFYISASGTITSNANSSGKYVKIGKNVYIWGFVSYASNVSASGNITVGGLPFTSAASGAGFGQSGNRTGGVFSIGSNLFASNTPNLALITQAATIMTPYIQTSSGITQLTFADFILSNNNSQFLFAGQYVTS